MSTNIFLPYDTMPPWALVLLMLIGIALLWLGGDKLTGGAAAVGLHMNIDPVIIGLTIISIATSLPELVTSLVASVMGSPDVAVGNIVGSNLANIGLILGISGLVWSFRPQTKLVMNEMPILLIVTLIFCAMGYSDGMLDRREGLVLLCLTASYLWFVVMRRRRNVLEAVNSDKDVALDLPQMTMAKAVAWVLLGGVFLALGSDVLVNASVAEARHLGVSELIIGLTIVAVGTSLPELAATVAASVKGHGDMVAGNIVGSNLFNMMLIGGSVSALSPVSFSRKLFNIEIPAMFGLTVLLWLLMRRMEKIGRMEGGVLLLAYAVIMWTSVRAS